MPRIAASTRSQRVPKEPDPLQALATAQAIDQLLTEAGIVLPQVHHGEGLATWAVLEAALARGHFIRIGFEDTTQRPDGLPARDNAELVTFAVEMARRHGRQPLSVGTIPDSSG